MCPVHHSTILASCHALGYTPRPFWRCPPRCGPLSVVRRALLPYDLLSASLLNGSLTSHGYSCPSDAPLTISPTCSRQCAGSSQSSLICSLRLTFNNGSPRGYRHPLPLQACREPVCASSMARTRRGPFMHAPALPRMLPPWMEWR